MLGNISPLRPNPKEDGNPRSDRIKPQAPPRDDSFRKSMRDRPQQSKEEEENASTVEEREEAPSLFDLSKTKNKSSTGKSALKNSNTPDFATDRPVTAKQEDNQGQEQESNSFATGEAEITNTEMLQPEAETETVQPKLFGQTKEPIDQPPNLLDVAKKTPEEAMASVQNPQKSQKTNKETAFETRDQLESGPKKQKLEEEEPRSGVTARSKEGEITAANMAVTSTSFQTETSQASQKSIPAATIREIATQIVDRIQVMRKDNETQTTITLRQPPILEGATITLTASDNAKREFNIAFANLSPDAKRLLDHRLKEHSLTEILETKGITVHMLTTSTQAENPIMTDAGQSFRDRQDQQQEQQEQQQRRRNFQESEEEVT